MSYPPEDYSNQPVSMWIMTYSYFHIEDKRISENEFFRGNSSVSTKNITF